MKVRSLLQLRDLQTSKGTTFPMTKDMKAFYF